MQSVITSVIIFCCCCSLLNNRINAKPLYEEKFKQPGAKILLPPDDPLTASSSDELPMVHNNNYDMIMPDYADQHPAESMHYQNFEKFFDPEMLDDNNEYKMMESQFIHTNPVRAPQPLSAQERRIREKLEEFDVKHEKKQLLKLKKGNTQPRLDAPEWDQFDYDYYSVNPADKKHKKSYYG